MARRQAMDVGPLRWLVLLVTAATVLAWPQPSVATVRLTVQLSGGTGAVEAPSGPMCARGDATAPDTVCEYAVADDDVVTLSATPTGDFNAVTWQAPSSCGGEQRCDVAMNGADQTAAVTVEPGPAMLQVLPSLPGSVTIDPPGDDGSGNLVDICDVPAQSQGCTLRYSRGQTVTLTPNPVAVAGPFVGWSPVECAGQLVCTLTLTEAMTTATVTYDPQRLAISSLGDGTISGSAGGVDISCNPGPCEASYPYGTQVVLSGQATGQPPQDVHWFRGCDEGPHLGGVCTATVIADPWWVTANFGGTEEPQIPPVVETTFKVRKGGTGSGRVKGPGIDCGRDCSTRYNYGTRLTLIADPDGGSAFARWDGACGTRATCTVPAGPISSVRAIFEPQAGVAEAPRSEAGTGAPAPPLPGAGGEPTAQGQGPGVVLPALALHGVGVRAIGRGSKRRIAVALTLSRPARVQLSLLRARRRIATRSVQLGAGPHRLTLRVPRRAGRGRYVLQIRVNSGGDRFTVVRRVRMRG